MDKPKTTPKDFFLWAGAMVALYVAVFNYIALLWDYINYTFPDPLAYYVSDPYQSGISWEMASLIVLSPLFLFLMWYIHRSIRADATRADIWVRKWALFLTLFVAGFSIAVDLIYVLYTFLNGSDLTARFLLKALVVLMVAAIGFMHFIADLWGYWEKYPGRNKMVAWATGILVLVSIVAGFFIVGSPSQARLVRFDDQKTQDLQNIQSQVVNYWQSKQKLPASLSDLNDPLSNYTIPTDPQAEDSYTYKPTGTMSFQLCATFNVVSHNGSSATTVPVPTGIPGKGISDNWQHTAGSQCFDRTIDPERYPPYSKTNTQ